MAIKINIFNPAVTLEQFQTAIVSEAPEAEIKSIAMAALANYKIEELTKGLEPSLAAKVEGYSEERSGRILQAVKGLNNLCDQRDELVASCPAYKGVKASYKKAEEEASRYLEREHIEQAIQEVMPQDQQVRAKLEKLISKTLNRCVSTSPKTEIYGAMNALRNALNEKEPNAEKIAIQKKLVGQAVGRALVESLYEGKAVHMSEEEMDIFLQNVITDYTHINYPSEVREFVNSKLPGARKDAIAAYKNQLAASKKLMAEKTAAFKSHLTTYLETRAQYKTNDEYLKFAAQKKAVYDNFCAIGAFCTASEVLSHPKITNDSKARLNKTV